MPRDALRLTAAGVVAAGLVLSFVAAVNAAGLCWFFTIQVCAAYLLVTLAGGSGPLRTALVVYLLALGLVFVLVLANPWSGYSMTGVTAARGGVSDVANLLLHVAAPPLALAVWLRDRPVLAHPLRLLLWLPVYPLVYLGALLLRGATWSSAADRYLYPFLDVPQIGYAEVLRNVAVAAVVIVAVGVILARAARPRPEAVSVGAAADPSRD